MTKLYRKAPDWCAKAHKLNKKETDYERKYVYQTAGDGYLHLRADSRHRAYLALHPAGGAISRHRTSHSLCIRQLYGRRCRSCDEQRHHAAGREHQRGGRHDVYHVQRLQCRSGYHTGLLQARHRPRHGGCQRTEPCSQSTGTAARRSNESRRKHDETTDQLPANRRDGLHRRSLRPDLPCQLSGHQRHPADQTYRGSRRRHGAGRYLQYAYLAETGTDGTIRAGAFGHHRRAGRAEHRSPYRLTGREFAERLPVHDEISRKTEERGRISEHRCPLA